MLVFRPLCENYVIKWTRQGMAKDLDQLNNFKVSTTIRNGVDLRTAMFVLTCRLC
jgi:dedicator of cytokinesis protein 1